MSRIRYNILMLSLHAYKFDRASVLYVHLNVNSSLNIIGHFAHKNMFPSSTIFFIIKIPKRTGDVIRFRKMKKILLTDNRNTATMYTCQVITLWIALDCVKNKMALQFKISFHQFS